MLPAPASTKHHLEAVARARIVFGHQSVGRNLLAGVGRLAAEHNVALDVTEAGNAPKAAGLLHANIGSNGNPQSKCDAFANLLLSMNGGCDLAAMKFCYVDLTRRGPLGPAALLGAYAAMIDVVRARLPGLRIVHITMPLRSETVGRKAKLKRLLRIAVPGDADNAARYVFNEALRKRYAAEPLFDLAGFEATRPDGSRSAVTHAGRSIPTLAAEHTDDGGHLNAGAQRAAAAAFLETLAGALTAPR